MAILAPFRGVRFNKDKILNLDEVVTPPYDVISEEDGAKFLEKNAYNMIQLDLRSNHRTPDQDDSVRYRQAKSLFDAWQDDQILVRDQKPAIYLYYIDYTHPSGRRMTRKGIISLVGLAEFSEGIVRPHEKTFETVIVDRMKLMDECKAQFSQVFSIYNDKDNVVITALEKAREPQPEYSVKDHLNNIHTLWKVTDRRAIDAVIDYFRDKPVYIADGHHRYTTALGCRNNALRDNPNLPADSPFNFIMMYLCATEDEGLSVLPTHRLLNYPAKLTADEVAAMLKKDFLLEEISGGAREVLVAEVLARMNEAVMTSPAPVFGFYHAGEDRTFLMTLKNKPGAHPSLADKPVVLQGLDVVILSDLIIGGLLNLDHQRIVREKLVGYYSDPDEAIDVAVKKSVAAKNGSTPLLFLLNPTRINQVTMVADSGEIMPHKSTYFYPKIVTGLMINKLAGEERVYRPEKGR